MDLITPDIGLLFWTTLVFIIVLIFLRLFAWTPVLNAIKTRENTINAALSAAEKAKAEYAKLEQKNEKLLAEARSERDALIREAREIKDKIINEARENANAEVSRLFESARRSIENEKISAIAQIKEQVALLSVEVAENILRKKLSNTQEQKDYIDRLLDEIELN
jgi:F-type H+-transporting ATPase subunit b